MSYSYTIQKLIHKLSGVDFRNDSAVKDLVRLIILEMNTTTLGSTDKVHYVIKTALTASLIMTLSNMKKIALYKDDIAHHNNFIFASGSKDALKLEADSRRFFKIGDDVGIQDILA